MDDKKKTKEQLIAELAELPQHDAKLKKLQVFGINSKVLIAFCLIAFFLISYFSFTNHIGFKNLEIQHSEQQLLLLTKSIAMNIQQLALERILDIQIMADDKLLQKGIIENDITPDIEQLLINTYKRHENNVAGISLLDSNGICLFNSSIFDASNCPGKDNSSIPYISYVLENRKPYLSEMFISEKGIKFVVFAFPVFQNEEFLGIINWMINFDLISSRFIQSISIGKKGHIQLFDDDGTIYIHPEPEQIGKNVMAYRKGIYPEYDWTEYEDILTKMYRGEEGVGTYHSLWWNEDNEMMRRKLIAYYPLNILNETWSVSAVMDYSEISVPIIKNSIFTVMIVGSISLILGILGLAIQRTQKEKAILYERAKKNQALIKSEEQINMLFNTIGDSIYIHDMNGRLLKVNNSACERLGYELDEYLKMPLKDIISPKFHPLMPEQLEKLKQGEYIVFESENVRKDGSIIPIEISSKIINYEGIPAVLGVARDITERKQLEEERDKASKLESIGILAGGIAHDFNNILAIILGNTSLAKISFDNKEEALELLTETENATIRATKLTQQLLTFAKGGAPVKELVALTELIRETTEFSLRGTNVNYQTSIPADLWTAEVDKGQISQVIGNLVINAQQAMPEGGTININAENVIVKPENHLPLSEGNYIKVSVADKGHGIPAEQLTKIFDPYFTTKQKGKGLGLSTVYSIIHRHDGHIAVESKIGAGTTFTIYLPASAEQVKDKETAKEDTAVLTGKILVMDDEEMIRNIVSKMLKRFGNDVDVACDGAEAIRVYKKAMKAGNHFDVVIMDLTIPGGMGGQEAIKKLLEIAPNAKAIVSSGYGSDPVVSNFAAYGFSGFISKPYKIEELKKVLNEVMSGENK